MPRSDYTVGSGNVFEDLGHPRPAEALAKAELARKITALISKRGLTPSCSAWSTARWTAGSRKCARAKCPGCSASRTVSSSRESRRRALCARWYSPNVPNMVREDHP